MERSPRPGEKEEQRILYRGQALGRSDVQRVRRLVRQAKGQNLGELCETVCRTFGWYRPNGEFRASSARELLRRLEARGLIELPQPWAGRREAGRRRRGPLRCPRPGEWPKLPELPGEDLVVRTILPQERGAWRDSVACHHYLGCGRLVGERLRYCAVLGGRVVALLAWAGAALKCGVRDRYIGWEEATKVAKLHFVVNNVRFVMLPEAQQKNLASRILAMNLRRLSADWARVYGHPVFLAETFVDASRFRGSCYKASNWLLLGETRGWARAGTGYQHHGERKLVFVYALSRGAIEFLKTPEPNRPNEPDVRRAPMIDVERLPLRGDGGLIEELEGIVDFRKPRGVRFSVAAILSIAACATICGAKSFAGIAQWANEVPRETLLRLGCRRKRPPSEKTYRRILGGIGMEAFEQRVGQWFARHVTFEGQGIAIDGKAARGSADGDAPAAHLLSAFTHGEGVVLAQTQVSEKTNEIPCVQPLLKDLEIEGAVVTADAMHTQRETARHIVEEKKADYLFTVKDNQPTLRDDIALLHLEAFPPSGHDGQQGPRAN